MIILDPADDARVTHFFIANITGGTLYKSDGKTKIDNGDVIRTAEGAAGLRFMPLPDRNTPAGDTFGFTVRAALDAKGSGMSPGAAVEITVTEVNDTPAITVDPPLIFGGSFPEDFRPLIFPRDRLLKDIRPGPANESGQTLSITAVQDVFGGAASRSRVTAITGGLLFKQGGALPLAVGKLITVPEGNAGLTFIPAPDGHGTDFSVALAAYDVSRDLAGPSTTATITVTEVNDPPTGVDDTLDAIVENAAAFTIPASRLTKNDAKGPANEGGQRLTIIAVTAGEGGTPVLDAGAQVITFTPASGFTGTVSFTYTVQDLRAVPAVRHQAWRRVLKSSGGRHSRWGAGLRSILTCDCQRKPHTFQP